MAKVRLLDDDGDWGDDDGGWDDSDDTPGDNLPGNEVPGDTLPGDAEGGLDEDWTGHDDFGRGDTYTDANGDIVGTMHLSLSDPATGNDPDIRDGGSWIDRDASASRDIGGPSGLSDSGPSIGPADSNRPSPPALSPSNRFTGGLSGGGGIGGAFGLGAVVMVQAGPNFGKRDTDFTGSVFLGFTGIGLYVSTPSPSLNFNIADTPSPQGSNAAEVSTCYCSRSTIMVMPIATLQLSYGCGDEPGGKIVAASLSLGLSLGLGAFAGYSCSYSIRSQGQPVFGR
ncbi:hypothetical protein [Pseudomonas sp. R16(2017)]|uniref:hypothetical protein n=1 Tax=Pseudomonas sp. R16(2017) TaxID=1981704 RepID=UPI00111C78EF|nr:hypothetical protein [Pseudomonas sp. R16(2017)]